MTALLLRPCSICNQAERLTNATRCAGCHRVFNTLRERDKTLQSKDGRTAPTAARLRAAVLGGAYVATPAKQLRSAGHSGKRDSLPSDPEVQAALGVLRDARGQRQGNQGYVYCIGEAEGVAPLVKIGYSTNPQARVAELQTGNGRKLFLLSYFAGTMDDERRLHEKYLDDNTLQEWFRPTNQLLSEFGYDLYDLYAKGSAAR